MMESFEVAVKFAQGLDKRVSGNKLSFAQTACAETVDQCGQIKNRVRILLKQFEQGGSIRRKKSAEHQIAVAR